MQSIDLYAPFLQVCPRQLYLLHQLLVRLWNIIKGKDAQSELEQQICAKGDNSPDRELSVGCGQQMCFC